MSIVYPLALPSTRQFRQVNWRQVDVTSDVASPFTGQSQTIDWGGRWFACTLTLVAMKDADAALWDAWLTSLFGHTGTFLLGFPGRSAPLGTARFAPGTPLVNGSGVARGDTTLPIDGLPAAARGYLKAGDFIQLGTAATSRLYKVLQDVDADGSGQATLDIWPGIREAPADNAAVTVSAPRAVFHRASAALDWTIGPDLITKERSFDVKERLT